MSKPITGAVPRNFINTKNLLLKKLTTMLLTFGKHK